MTDPNTAAELSIEGGQARGRPDGASPLAAAQAEEPTTLKRGVVEETAVQVRPATAVVEVPIAKIQVYDRQRTLRSDRVAALAESIAELGLMQAITVWPTSVSHDAFMREEVYNLVAGRHRLEACKRLGWMQIPAMITDASELKRRLWEIDENLCRAEINELEKAEHLLARKDIYEALHPETRHGGAPGKAGGGKTAKDAKLSSFAHDAAGKIGDTQRTIARSIRRAKKISPEVRDSIRGTAIADSGVELDALAALKPEDQQRIASKVIAGKAETVRQAMKARAPRAGNASARSPHAADRNRPKAAPKAEMTVDAKPRSGASTVAPAADPIKGSQIAVPEGISVEQLVRGGMARESGQSVAVIAKSLGLGVNAYRKIRYVVLLADRADFCEADLALARHAMAEINRTRQCGTAFKTVAGLVRRIYGDEPRARPERAEAIRQENFDRVLGLLSIVNHLHMVEIPYLDPERSRKLASELRETIDDLKRFVARVEEQTGTAA